MDKTKRKNVSSFSVQHFRGISDKQEIEFSKNERIVVLLGENGTGKSSFVNALEYLFKNKIDALKLQTKGVNKSYVHAGSKEKDLKIILSLGVDNDIVKEYNVDATSKSKATRKFLRQNKSFLSEASFILNRKKLLEFINNGNVARYDSLMKLCSLDEIENIKTQFKNVKKHYNSILKSKNNDLEISEKKLNKILSCDGNYIETINNELILINADLIDEKTDLKDYLITLDFQDRYDIIHNLNKFDDIYQKISIDEIDLKLTNILNEYSDIKNDSLQTLQYSSNLLENSQKYLEKTKDDKCPVCGSNIGNNELINKIESDYSKVKNLISSFDIWKNNVEKYILNLNALNSQIREINVLLEKLQIDLSIEEIELINDLNALINLEKFTIDYEFNPIKTKLELIKDSIDDKRQSLNEDENYEKIKILRQAINELNNYNQIKRDIEKLELKYDLAINTLDIYNETKKEHLDEIANNIEKNVQKYYKYLHGDDLIISPKIDVISDNSVGLLLESFGINSDPRLYSSEGHLDTLGLCIFLAFMREYNPLNLIVLDDIITTVDFSHKYHIAKLLIEEFYDFNILITTHNGLWAQQLRDIAKATSKREVRIEHILSWDFQSGPHIITKKDYSTLINDYLSVGEYPAAVNTARQYLEYSTLEYCKSHPVNIRIDDKYTLGTLYDAVKAATYHNNEKLDELWDELDKNYYIVNKLSHFNNDAFYVHSKEIEQLCDLVLEICPMLVKKT